MAHRFLSAAWVEAGRQLVEASPEFQKAARGLTARVLTEIRDAPPGVPRRLYHEFLEGRLVHAEAETNGEAPGRHAEVRIQGSYDTFRRLHEGGLTMQAAYFNGLVRLKGNTQLAMRYAPALVKYQQIMRRVETTF